MALYFPNSSSKYKDPRGIDPDQCRFVMGAEDQTPESGAVLCYDELNHRFLYITCPADNSYGYGMQAYRNALKNANVNDGFGSTLPILDPHIDYSALTKNEERDEKEAGEYQLDTNDKKIIYIHGGSWNDPDGVYAYFVDNKNHVYLYTMKYCGSAGKTRAEDDEEVLYTIECTELVEMTGANVDTPIYYWSMAAPTLVFYADGNTLYRYNTQTNSRSLVWTAEPGWNITKIKSKTVYTNQTYPVFEADGDVSAVRLLLALSNGDKGDLAEIKIKSNGDIDFSLEPIIYDNYQGTFLNIIDMYFAYTFKKVDMVN